MNPSLNIRSAVVAEYERLSVLWKGVEYLHHQAFRTSFVNQMKWGRLALPSKALSWARIARYLSPKRTTKLQDSLRYRFIK